MKKRIYSVVLLTMISLSITSFISINKPFLPTVLKVTVLDKLGNTVEGASVSLYESEDAYYEEKKPLRKAQKTDEKGRTTFKKLDPIQYYIHAEKGEKDNTRDNIGEKVATSKLKEGKVNLVNVIIR